MGCFNTILIPCPRCGEKYDYQSKSGSCSFTTETIEDAELEDIVEASNNVLSCGNCNASFKLHTKFEIEIYECKDVEKKRKRAEILTRKEKTDVSAE